jgi:hypothetical protein
MTCDLAGIETSFFIPPMIVLGCIIEQSFENDGALAADDCPRVVNLRPEEVKVVCNLGGLCVPGVPRGSSGARRGRRRSSRGGSRRRRGRRNTKAKESAGPIESSGILGRADQAVDSVGRCLRQCDAVDRDKPDQTDAD